MKKSSRNWSEDEDKMLAKTLLENNGTRKLRWQEVAQIMHSSIEGCQKTGKQCRERWHNHLAPELNNSSQWTKQENEILFLKHSQCGNKWAKIATFLKGRTDNCVKNHFYSTLRRGMRKVNNFIHDQRKQKNSIKQFKADVLTKILIVADGDPEQKLNAKNNAEVLSKKIKQLLIQISLGEDQNTYDAQQLDKIIQLIMEFNKNCKKRKGKKKGASQKSKHKQQQEEQQIQLSQQPSQSIKVETVSIVQPNFINKPEKKENILIKDNIDLIQREKQKQIQNLRQKKSQKQIQKISQKKQQSIIPQKILPKIKIIQCKNKQKEGGNIFQNSSFFNIKPQQIQNENSKEDQNINQIEDDKDQVRSVDLVDAPIIQKQQKHSIWKNQPKKIINRGNSIQSFNSQLNNIHNLTGSFYMNGTVNNQQPIFISSGFGLAFPPEQPMASKQMFGESGVGIKKNQALMHFSAVSGDQRNSFFKMQGQRGVLEPQQLLGNNEFEHQKYNSNNITTNFNQQEGFKFKRQPNSPGIFSNSFMNVNSFTKSEILNAQKNFLLSSQDFNRGNSNAKKQVHGP